MADLTIEERLALARRGAHRRMTITVPAHVHEQVKRLAERHGTDWSTAATILIEAALAYAQPDPATCQHTWDRETGPTLTCTRCGYQVHRVE